MKKLILIIIAAILTVAAKSQIPYYGNTQGKGETYTYFSTKFHPGVNNQQMYITAQHGVLNKLDLVTDATIGTNWAYQGWGIRFNVFKSNKLSIGGQLMADFDINNSYKFNYNCNSLYLHWYLNKSLHFVSNTWWTIYDESDNTVEQWTYIGYHIGKFTPMIGIDNYFTKSHGSDLMAGIYYSVGKVNVYAWSSNLTKNFGDTRVVLGFDYKF